MSLPWVFISGGRGVFCIGRLVQAGSNIFFDLSAMLSSFINLFIALFLAIGIFLYKRTIL
jgi:hypothetical protein